jgi:pentatricopeptide repeat protein
MSDEKYTKTPEILKFGAIRLHTATGELRTPDGERLSLRPQSAEVLSLLLQHAGEVVSERVMLDTVWQGIITTDDSLAQCIEDIRGVLGGQSVETVPNGGYRLRIPDVAPDDASAADHTERQWLPFVIAGVGAVLAFAIALFLSKPDHRSATGNEAADITLAVLPFISLGSATDPLFSNGLAEDLSTDLSKTSGLQVISYGSSSGYVNADSGFREIAEALGADYLVRGTVTEQDDRVRVNVSLIDPENGLNIWADRYDRPMDNPFDVQTQAANQIIRALSINRAVEQTTPNRIPQAYRMLLRGMDRLREATPVAYEEARGYFRRALAFDPDYARAHAGVAVTYARSAMLAGSEEDTQQQVEAGLESAMAAIGSNAEQPLAYFAVGLLNITLKDHEKAIDAARNSIELYPSFADGYALLAEASLYGGDLNEGLSAMRQAKKLHPHFPPSYLWIEGSLLYYLNRYNDAENLLSTFFELTPESRAGMLMLAASYVQMDDIEKAKAVIASMSEDGVMPDTEKEIDQLPFSLEERSESIRDALSKI